MTSHGICQIMGVSSRKGELFPFLDKNGAHKNNACTKAAGFLSRTSFSRKSAGNSRKSSRKTSCPDISTVTSSRESSASPVSFKTSWTSLLLHRKTSSSGSKTSSPAAGATAAAGSHSKKPSPFRSELWAICKVYFMPASCRLGAVQN